MDPVRSTLAVYERDASKLCAGYLAHVRNPEHADPVEWITGAVRAGSVILDVGCGSGRDLGRMRSYGFDAVGLDASPEMAHRAGRFGPVLIGDMWSLPFPDRSVDAVLASASLLHLPDDAAVSAMAEFARVLPAGGRLVVTVKHGQGEMVDGSGRYFRLYEEREIDQLIEACGFHVSRRSFDSDTTRPDTAWLVRGAVRY